MASMSVASGAVTTIPLAPDGFQWQLVQNDIFDSEVIDTSAAEAAIVNALSFSGSSAPPLTESASTSQTLSFAAFGQPEPGTYSVGDFLDVVTANTFSASMQVFTTAGVTNPDEEFVLIQSELSGVQISSALGSTTPDSDVQTALSDSSVVVTNPTANASSALSGSLTQIEGENVSFTFSASDSFSFSKPFGGSGAATLNYFVTPSANLSLRRDTTYTRFQLVTNAEAGSGVPEPSSVLLAGLSLMLLLRRNRH